MTIALLITWSIWAIIAICWVDGIPLYKKKIITRGANDEEYLIRYSIPWLTCKWFSVKIHHILMSDPVCEHSHPWSFLSIILKGGYLEHQTIEKMNAGFEFGGGERTISFKVSRYFGAGNFLWRPKNTIHRLQLLERDGKPQTVWTFVITFRKVQEWGFFTPSGFVNWRDYDDSKGGCEA